MEITNFSHGVAKRKQMMHSFGQLAENAVEKALKGAKLDTSHLVLKEVDVNGKMERRWVDPNKGNAEHAPRGTAVNFQHKGATKKGVIGRVAPNGQYEVHTKEGSIYKHPHQFEHGDGGGEKETVKPQGKEKTAEEPTTELDKDTLASLKDINNLKKRDTHQLMGMYKDPKMPRDIKVKIEKVLGYRDENFKPDGSASTHAKEASTGALKNALKDTEIDGDLKEAAQRELESRSGKTKKETEKKSIFHKYKEKKDLEEKGLDLEDPEIKEMHDLAKDFSLKELKDIQENENLTDKEEIVIKHLIKQKDNTPADEKIEKYEHAIRQTLDAPRANLFVYGKGGAGKAQRLTDKVLTPTGWKQMGDLKVGDKVLTPSGRHSKIIGVFPQGKKDIYKMTLSDFSEVFSCKEHLWKVWNKRRKMFQILSLKEIINLKIFGKNKHGVRRYKYQIPYLPNPVEYSIEKKMPVDPWLLGYLLGDGTLKQGVVFTVGQRDKDFILKKVKSLMPKDCSISCYSEELGSYAIIKKDQSKRMPSSLRKELVKLGVCVGSKEKFIPEIYKTSSVGDRLKLIQGLMDSDGFVDKKGGSIFGVSSEKLARDLREIIKSFGRSAIYKKTKIKKATGLAAIRESYKPIPGYVVHFFLPPGFTPMTLPFRFKRFIASGKTEKINGEKSFYKNGLTIKNIEYHSNEEAQCIMIDDPEHLYITDNFITTHNTYQARKIAESKYGEGAEYDPAFDSYGSKDYDYIFPDKVTQSALYELLYAHNGKTLFFDDADGILKDPDIVNMLKKAMDTSDSRIGKDTKGGKPMILKDKATGEDVIVPSSFKFTGKIIFISNKPKEFFTHDEDRRALLSRGNSLELQFNNHETRDLMKNKIVPGIKKNADLKTLGNTIPRAEDGSVDKTSKEYKQFGEDIDHAFSYVDKHIDDIPDNKLNGRVIENLYQSYKYAQKYNDTVKGGKKLDVDKYLIDQLTKAEYDDLNQEIETDISKALLEIGVTEEIERFLFVEDELTKGIEDKCPKCKKKMQDNECKKCGYVDVEKAINSLLI